jgi:hypothetical protein
MREADAYLRLGWPLAGAAFFVLPMSGSDRTDWITYMCPNVGTCGYRGLGVPESFKDPAWLKEMSVCPQCRVPWVMSE